MTGTTIRPEAWESDALCRGDLVHDGRAYDWLTCPACDRRFGSERARWEK